MAEGQTGVAAIRRQDGEPGVQILLAEVVNGRSVRRGHVDYTPEQAAQVVEQILDVLAGGPGAGRTVQSKI